MTPLGIGRKETIDISNIVIRRFVPKEATRETYDKLHPFREINFRELYPEDSLPNRDVIEQKYLAGWPGYEDYNYIVYKDESEQEIVATYEYDVIKNCFFYFIILFCFHVICPYCVNHIFYR